MASQYSAFTRRMKVLPRLKTEGGVRYALLSGPTYDATSESVTATTTILIRSRDLKPFHKEAFPPPIFLFEVSRRLTNTRLPGAPWMVMESFTSRPHNPDLPGDPFEGHKEDSITIEGEDDGEFNQADPPGTPGESGHPYSEFYEVVITYSSQFHADDNDEDPNDPETFIEVQKTGGGQFLSVPPVNTSTNEESVPDSPGAADTVKRADGTKVREGDTADKTNPSQQMGIVMTIPTIEYTFTWPLVINPPFRLMDLALGKVNGTFMSIFDNAPLETVLFMGYNAKRKYIWDGATGRAQPYEIQYKFSRRMITRSSTAGAFGEVDPPARSFGWNHQFNGTEGEWERIKMANGRSVHDKTDFLALFRTTPLPEPVTT